jgi:hypothetical protein
LRRPLEHRHVPLCELPTRTQPIPLHIELLYKSLDRRHRASVPYDPDASVPLKKRHDLIAYQVVGQQRHVGRKMLQAIRRLWRRE